MLSGGATTGEAGVQFAGVVQEATYAGTGRTSMKPLPLSQAGAGM
jgi:hypothetical protein